MEILAQPNPMLGLVLDMDRTLYPAVEADPYLKEGAAGEWVFICQKLRRERSEAEARVRAKKQTIEERLGRTTSLTAALVELGISKCDWDRVRGECYFPEKHIASNPGLRAALTAAQRRMKLCIFTNSPRPVATRIVKAIGIHDLGIQLIGVDDISSFKPDPVAFVAAARLTGLEMKTLVSIGDRRDIDCVVPLEAGYGGAVHVSGPEEVVTFCQNSCI